MFILTKSTKQKNQRHVKVQTGISEFQNMAPALRTEHIGGKECKIGFKINNLLTQSTTFVTE